MPQKKTLPQLARARIGLRSSEHYTLKERAMLKSGVRPEAIAAQRRLEDEIHKNIHQFKERTRRLRAGTPQTEFGNRRWVDNRDFSEHEILFDAALKETGRPPLLETITQMARKTKGPLRILDESAGQGFFPVDLKEKLERKGIKTETTAVSIEKNQALEYWKSMGKIDNVIFGAMESFMPRKKQHLIVGLAGALHYSNPDTRISTTRNPLSKQLLLKYAYSLEKGGMALIGLDTFQSTLTVLENFTRFRKAMKGRGFKAEIVFTKIEEEMRKRLKLPHEVVVIERIR